MEACNAQRVVITLIMEKTPIIIPEMVNADRSLWAPRERHAIATISSRGGFGTGAPRLRVGSLKPSGPGKIRPSLITQGFDRVEPRRLPSGDKARKDAGQRRNDQRHRHQRWRESNGKRWKRKRHQRKEAESQNQPDRASDQAD